MSSGTLSTCPCGKIWKYLIFYHDLCFFKNVVTCETWSDSWQKVVQKLWAALLQPRNSSDKNSVKFVLIKRSFKGSLSLGGFPSEEDINWVFTTKCYYCLFANHQQHPRSNNHCYILIFIIITSKIVSGHYNSHPVGARYFQYGNDLTYFVSYHKEVWLRLHHASGRSIVILIKFSGTRDTSIK